MKLHHGETERPKEHRFAKFAIAGAVLVSTLGCAGASSNVLPSPTRYISRSVTYDDNDAERVNVLGVDARVLYPTRPIRDLISESTWYRRIHEVDSSRGTPLYVYSAEVNRYSYEPMYSNGVMARFQFVFIMTAQAHDNCTFSVTFPPDSDLAPTDPQSPGIRKYEFNTFMEAINRALNNVIIVVDLNAGVPGSVTAHAIPRNADDQVIGTLPEGQIAYSITFYPMSHRAIGGWSVLR